MGKKNVVTDSKRLLAKDLPFITGSCSVSPKKASKHKHLLPVIIPIFQDLVLEKPSY